MAGSDIKVTTTAQGVITKIGTAIPGGDGRGSDVPLFVIGGSVSTSTAVDGTVTTIFSPETAAAPGYVQIADRATGNAATVLSSGANQYALSVMDKDVRKMLENLLYQQIITNRLLFQLMPPGSTVELDERGI